MSAVLPDDSSGVPPAPGREPARGERGSLPFGRIAGVPLRLHWSWAIVVILITWSLAGVLFPDQNPGMSDAVYMAMGITATLVFFATLLAHELGHALQARREGMRIDGITLWVFGGVARFSGMFPSAGAELRIALAGPAVTALVTAISLAAAAVLPLPSATDGVVTWVGSTNLLLLGFNMLPALPLDGGRVLRALVWQRTGDFPRATRLAGRLGSAIGQLLIAGGILLFFYGGFGGLWLAVIGWFIVSAAASEVQLGELERILADATVRDAMIAEPVTVAASSTLREFIDDTYARSRHAAYPVLSDGTVVGEITFRAVAAVPPAEWPQRLVSGVMLPLRDVYVVAEDAPLFPAVVELMTRAPNRALVTGEGRLAGLLSITDVSRLLELRRLTQQQSAGGY